MATIYIDVPWPVPDQAAARHPAANPKMAAAGAGIATIGPSTSARTTIRPSIISRSEHRPNSSMNRVPASRP